MPGTEDVFKGITDSLTGFVKSQTKAEQAKQKMMGVIAEAQIKGKMNMMQKMIMQQNDPKYQMDQIMLDQMKSNMPGAGGQGGGQPGGGATPDMDFEKFMSTERIRWTGSKMEKGLPTKAEGYAILQKKPENQRTPKEKAFINQYLYGEKAGAEKVPSWLQEQQVQSMKQGILRGQILVGKQAWGDPIVRTPKTREEAMDALIEANENPYLYEDELDQKYGTEAQETLPKDGAPNLQAQIDKAKAAGYTEKEINAYLRRK